MQGRQKDWLNQALGDYSWAKDSLSGHFAGACFIAQHSAEKAVKGICFHRGFASVKSHSILEIVKELEINGPLREAAGRLDQYYITARYPDSIPSGYPAEFFSETQAKEVLQLCELLFTAAEKEIGT